MFTVAAPGPALNSYGSILDPLGWGCILPTDPRANGVTAAWPNANSAIAARFLGGLGKQGAAGYSNFGGLVSITFQVGISSGNIDAGIWNDEAHERNDPQYQGFFMSPGLTAPVTTAGSTACPAAGAATLIVAGGSGVEALQDRHWLVFACNNTTATFTKGMTPNNVALVQNNQRYASVFPITATGGFNGSANLYFPLIWGNGWVNPANP